MSKNVESYTDEQRKSFDFVGYIFLFNSILILIQAYFLETIDFSSNIASVVFDVLFAILLITRPSKVIIYITVFRSAIGLLIYGIGFINSNDYLSLLLQALFSTSIIYLLLASPSIKIRNIVVGLGFALILSFAGFTSSSIIIAHNLGYYYSLEAEHVDSVKGIYYDYELVVESSNWFLRDREAALKENPVVDQWIVNPEFDAHVLVIGETLQPGQSLTLFALKDAVINNLDNVAEEKKEISNYSTTNKFHDGLIIHSKLKNQSIDYDYLHGLYIIGDKVFQVNSFCKSENFKYLEPTFYNIINSFKCLDTLEKVIDEPVIKI